MKISRITQLFNNNRKRYFVLILGLILLSLIPSGKTMAATEPPLPNLGEFAPVIPPGEPTEVKIGLYMIALDRVSAPSDASPEFEVEMFMDLQWKDERLAFDAEEYGYGRKIYEEHAAELELEQIWWPDVEIENEIHGRETENLGLIIFPDGTVEYAERFVVTVHADFDLRKFPFDDQYFELDLESFVWDSRYLVFIPNEDRIGYDPHYTGEEWIIDSLFTEVKLEEEIRSDEAFSEFVYTLHGKRLPQFYIMKIFPMFLIIILTWSVFWLEGATAPEMSISFIGLLTVVAFHRIFSGLLPRLSYMTYLDGVIFVGYFFASLAIIENVIVRRVSEEEGAKLDRIFQRYVPLSFVILNVLLVLIFLV